LFDFINEKPYINLASNLRNIMIDEGIRSINIGSMYIINSIDDIANLDCKVLIHLLYTPNSNNSIMEDSFKYSYDLLKKIVNINIFRCLTEEREKAEKGDTRKGAGALVPAKNMYTTYRPENDKYVNISCSGKTRTLSGKQTAKDNPKCTYGDMLNYVDNFTKHCYEYTKFDLFKEINNFISQEFYKYMPICFIFSINIHICKKLFKSVGSGIDIVFNRQFVIQIRESTPYVKYIDTFEEFKLDSLKTQDAASIPLLNISKYHKLFFIVSTEDIDANACPWLKDKDKFDLGDPWLSINDMQELIKKSNKYRDIIGFTLNYVPVFVASNFIKNILSLTLLYSTLAENSRQNSFIYYVTPTVKTGVHYGNFHNITDFLLKISFNRIILELLDYIKKLKPNLRYDEFNKIMGNINKLIKEPIIIEKLNDDDDKTETITLLKENFDSVKTMMTLNLSAEQIFNYCIKTIDSTDVNIFLKKLKTINDSFEKEKQPVLHAASSSGFFKRASAQGASAQGASAQGASAQGASAQGASAQGASDQTVSAQTASAQGASDQTVSAQTVSAQTGGSRMRLGIRNKKTKKHIKNI
jgi:hypothetical protein